MLQKMMSNVKNGRKIIESISLLWIGSILSAGITFLIQTILARQLGPTDYGTFSASLVTVGLLTPLAVFGIPQFWLKIFGTEGWKATRRLNPSLKFIVTSTSFALILLFIWSIIGPNDDLFSLLLIILSTYILGQVSVELVSAKLQLEEKYVALSFWQVFPSFLRLILILVLISVFSGKTEIVNVAYIYMVVSLLVTIIGIYQLNRMLKGIFELKGHSNIPNEEIVEKQHETWKADLIGVIKQIWPFGLAGLFHLIYYQSDITLVKYILGYDEVGIYSVAYTIMAGVYVFPNVIYQKYLLPKIHRWATYDKLKFYQFYRQGNIAMLLIGIAIMFGIWAIAPWLISLLDYYPSCIIESAIKYYLLMIP